MATVISKRDLERMKAMAYGGNGSSGSLTSKDEQLAKLSQERMQKWPNTLSAIRKKKENMVVERAMEKERINKQMDEEEEILRLKQRQEALDRASNLMFKQTDNMKLLKSQKLLSDTIATRDEQIQEKKRKEEIEKRKNDEYHQFIIAQVQKAEELEKLKIEERERQIQLVSETRSKQFNEVKFKKEKEKLELKKMGLEFKEQAKSEFLKEMKKNENLALEQKQQTENMLLYNEKLKTIREEMRQQEQQAQAVRDKEIETIEARNNMKKKIEKDLHHAKNQKRQDLIDAATKKLNEFQNQETQILLKQENDIKAKQLQKDADKAKKAQDDWEETLRSRNAQIEAKKRAKELQKQEDAQQIEIFKKTNEYELEKEKTKQRLAREKEDNLKKLLRQEAEEKRFQSTLDKERLLIEQNQFLSSLKDDNRAFTQLCLQDIEEYKSKGKPIFPLEEALYRANPKPVVKKTQSNCLALNVPV